MSFEIRIGVSSIGQLATNSLTYGGGGGGGGGGENYISLFSEPLMMKGGREEVARARLPTPILPPIV